MYDSIFIGDIYTVIFHLSYEKVFLLATQFGIANCPCSFYISRVAKYSIKYSLRIFVSLQFFS